MRYKILLIVAFAFFLRFFSLSSFPYGFTPDEASFGYDAYSMLKTGKDQWGRPFPLVLESFGDYKSPLYAYLTIPFVWTFGLTKFSVRLPNVLLGSAAVYITYLLAREIRRFYGKRMEIGKWKMEDLAAALLAVSPWHVMMSRGAFEANLTTFFLPLGIYLFMKGLKNPKLLISSSIIFGLNIFSYHAAKLVTPIVLGTLVFTFFSDIKKLTTRQKLVPLGVFCFFISLFVYTLFQGSSTRASGLLIFKGSLEASAGERLNTILFGVPETGARILHNKFQVGARRFVSSYFQYFSPQFLFVQGSAEATYGMIPGRGVLYWFELPFLIWAFIYFVRRAVVKPFLPILIWLIVAPIPAALSTGPGYAANRAVIALPAVQIFLALGAFQFFNSINQSRVKSFAKGILSIYVLFSILIFIYFLDDYFVQSPFKSAKQMLYGNFEAALWLTQNIDETKEIVVSTKLSEPHIYIAFAKEWNPIDYQSQVSKWNYKELGLGWVDQMPVYNLGNYYFRPINWTSENGSLFVGKPDEFPLDVEPVEQIEYPDTSPAIYIVKTPTN